MISVIQKIPLYEIDSNNTDTVETPTMEVRSHWNDDGMIVLQIDPKSKSVTVRAADLKAAIANAQNSATRG